MTYLDLPFEQRALNNSANCKKNYLNTQVLLALQPLDQLLIHLLREYPMYIIFHSKLNMHMVKLKKKNNYIYFLSEFWISESGLNFFHVGMFFCI